MSHMSKEELEQLRKNIGIRLKFERMKMGMSQEELAFELDISDRQYRRYEAGECKLPHWIAARLRWMNKADLNFLYVGKLMQDTRLNMGMKTIPDERLEEIMQICLQATDNMEEIREREPIIATMKELMDYGEKHWNPEIAKEPPVFPFFTSIYIEDGIAEIESHGLKWEDTLPTDI